MWPVCKFLSLALLGFLAACSFGGQTPVPIPRGMRAVSIHLREKITLAKGDHVDVVLIDKASPHTVMAENVPVVAFRDSENIVTLLVNQEDSDKIMTAATGSKVSVVAHHSF
jgi:Flp pilus assembly protein CpaB